MSLQLILGGAGTGKSYLAYQKIIKGSLEEPDSRYLIIVPEQFTMETQKDITAMHPDHGIINIDILSFLRLAYTVFEETGEQERPVLEDMGKSMLLRKVVEQKKGELLFLGNNLKKAGFLDELKSLLSEIFQYSISEDTMMEMIELTGKKPMLHKKLKDILTVYQGFRELLRDHYITAEEILDILYEVLARSEVIRNSVICFDGFTGFTPSQYKLITRLLGMAKKIYVTVTIDGREDISRLDEEFRLFHLSKKTIAKLQEIAKEAHTEVLGPIWAGGRENTGRRYIHSPALGALEHNLFRYPAGCFLEEQEDISIHAAHDREGEIDFVIRRILSLIKENGWHYRDIAVVSGDVEGYGRIVEKKFTDSGLPCFIDRKKDILSNPLVELIRSLLEIADRDFDYTGVFRYLRCGFAGIEKEKIDSLENYILALGIRGFHQWSRPFQRRYRKHPVLDLESINQCRMEIMEKLTPLREAFHGKDNTILDYTKALYDFIAAEGIYEQLEALRKRFEEQNEPLRAKEYKQVYAIVMEIFDRLTELLGDDIVSVREYAELLETGFAEAKVGLIPPGVDQIVVGDIERTRLKDVRALFFVGVNDGVIPKAAGSGGLLSDLEREMLKSYDFELAPSKREKSFTEQFYLYLNLTKPQNKLFLTYAKVGADGKAKNPSYLIGKIKTIFPRQEILCEDIPQETIEYILGGDKGRSYLLSGLCSYPHEEMPDVWKEVYSSFFLREEDKKELEHLAQAVFYTGKSQNISKTAARLLYGQELHNSVTRLEKYAECAFAHFLSYGLNLKERARYQLAVPDMGNLFHSAIECFSKKMTQGGYSWHTIEDQERDILAQEAVREVAEEFGNTILLSSKRNEYMINRIERMTKRTLWALSRQLREGKFEPAGYEVSFSPLDNLASTVLKLSDEETLRLRGRIDRMDLCEEEKELYLKIIDYKSGKTNFDLQKVYHGLQLQLVVYLSASMELAKKKHPDKTVIPAGIFYYNIDDPVIERPLGGLSEEEIRERILAELKMNGLANGDKKILSLMDQAFLKEKSVKSTIIPVEITSKGEFGAYSQVAAQEQFEDLSGFVQEKIKRFGKEIIDGNAEISPYRLQKATACDYCGYKGICGFDRRLPGYGYRDLKTVPKELIWEQIKGDDNG